MISGVNLWATWILVRCQPNRAMRLFYYYYYCDAIAKQLWSKPKLKTKERRRAVTFDSWRGAVFLVKLAFFRTSCDTAIFAEKSTLFYTLLYPLSIPPTWLHLSQTQTLPATRSWNEVLHFIFMFFFFFVLYFFFQMWKNMKIFSLPFSPVQLDVLSHWKHFTFPQSTAQTAQLVQQRAVSIRTQTYLSRPDKYFPRRWSVCAKDIVFISFFLLWPARFFNVHFTAAKALKFQTPRSLFCHRWKKKQPACRSLWCVQLFLLLPGGPLAVSEISAFDAGYRFMMYFSLIYYVYRLVGW